MCCRPHSNGYNTRRDPSVASNPFYSTQTSSRRGSSASILSERRSSYQYGRKCSDASIVNGRRISETVCRREVVFSPIHEYNEEIQMTASNLESFTSTNKLESSKNEDIKDENDVRESIENAIKLESEEVTDSLDKRYEIIGTEV